LPLVRPFRKTDQHPGGARGQADRGGDGDGGRHGSRGGVGSPRL